MSDPTPFEPLQPPPPPPPPQPPPVYAQPGLSNNAAAALAYFTFIPAIIFLIVEPYNRNPFVRFHSWQSIFLNIGAFVLNIGLSLVLGMVFAFSPFLHLALWPLINLFWFIVWILCVVNAFNGKRFMLPVIGPLAEKQAQGQIT